MLNNLYTVELDLITIEEGTINFHYLFIFYRRSSVYVVISLSFVINNMFTTSYLLTYKKILFYYTSK